MFTITSTRIVGLIAVVCAVIVAPRRAATAGSRSVTNRAASTSALSTIFLDTSSSRST